MSRQSSRLILLAIALAIGCMVALVVLTGCAAAPAAVAPVTPAPTPAPTVALSTDEAAYVAALARAEVTYADVVDIVRKGRALCDLLNRGDEPAELAGEILVDPFPDQRAHDDRHYSVSSGQRIIAAAQANLC